MWQDINMRKPANKNQNRQFSTDPDKTLTRHDVRPRFIRE